ncbi:MAG TPA: hypothetical protein PKA71_02215 [Saprospiraceae bacterium]|nr:hypothetical protein [Saprospiraceae bacterium]
MMLTNEVLAEALKVLAESTPEARKIIIEKSKYGEELFAGYYFSEYIKYPFAPFHFEMFQDWRDLRSGKIRELAWIIYREAAKTAITKILLTKMICYKEKMYPNADSLDKKNSENLLFDIASNLLSNRRIIRDFGQLYDRKRAQDELTRTRMDNFLTKNGVLLEAHSVAESVRGRLFGHQRPDFLVLDDFETSKTKSSEAYTRSTKEHIEEFASGLDAKAGVLYLGNYITKTGIVQWLMDRSLEDPRVRVRNVPAIIDGEPTWPAKYALTNEEAERTGKVSLEDKRKQLGTVVFETEMMNNPIASEYAVFKEEMFFHVSLEEVLKKTTRVFMTLDTAISKTKNGDYTGVAINFVDMEGKWNVMSFKIRMTPREVFDFIFTYWEKYNIETVGIEKTTFQTALKEFFEEECRKRKKFPNIVELKHGGVKKEERIRGALLGRYETRSINHIIGFCKELENNLLAFPMCSHDDDIDALAYLDQISESPFSKVETKVRAHIPQNCA